MFMKSKKCKTHDDMMMVFTFYFYRMFMVDI